MGTETGRVVMANSRRKGENAGVMARRKKSRKRRTFAGQKNVLG